MSVVLAVTLWVDRAGAVSIDPSASPACQAAISGTVRERNELTRQWLSGDLRGYNRWSGVTETATALREKLARAQARLSKLVADGENTVAFSGSVSTSATAIRQSIGAARAAGNGAQVERLQRSLTIWKTSYDRQKKEVEENIARILDVLGLMERDYQIKLAALDAAIAEAGQDICNSPAPREPEAPPNCDIAGRYERLERDIDDLAAIGTKLRGYVERPLPEQYEPDIPTLCIAGDEATISYKGFWRQVSDRAQEVNDAISFVQSGADVFGLGLPTTELTKLESFAQTIVGMGRDEILRRRDRTVSYEQGLAEYQELRSLQEAAQSAAETLRQRQICTVRQGLPEFYSRYRQLIQESKSIRQDAARCQQPRQGVSTVALKQIYDWHHRGALRDRLGPNQDTGWTSRRGWLDQGYSGNGIPPVLTSVICD